MNLTLRGAGGFGETSRALTTATRTGSPSLEAQVADLADEITYYSHDLDDALDFAILDRDQLDESAIWRRSHERVAAAHPELLGAELHKNIIRDIIDLQVRDVVATSAAAIAAAAPADAEAVRREAGALIRYSEELAPRTASCGVFFTRMFITIREWRKVNRTGLRDVAGGV